MLVLIPCSAACGPSEEKREAQAVQAAINRVRKADHPGRAPVLVELEQLTAKGLQAEQARAACAIAFRALEDAETLTAKVEKEVAAHSSAGIAPPADLLTRLEEAQKLLDGSEAKMPACQQAVKALQQLLR